MGEIRECSASCPKKKKLFFSFLKLTIYEKGSDGAFEKLVGHKSSILLCVRAPLMACVGCSMYFKNNYRVFNKCNIT